MEKEWNTELEDEFIYIWVENDFQNLQTCILRTNSNVFRISNIPLAYKNLIARANSRTTINSVFSSLLTHPGSQLDSYKRKLNKLRKSDEISEIIDSQYNTLLVGGFYMGEISKNSVSENEFSNRHRTNPGVSFDAGVIILISHYTSSSVKNILSNFSFQTAPSDDPHYFQHITVPIIESQINIIESMFSDDTIKRLSKELKDINEETFTKVSTFNLDG